MIGYLKWCSRKLVSEPLAWTAAVMLLGFAAAAAGCPDPWPQYTAMLGVVIMLVYTLGLMLQVSYQRKQQEIVDQLQGKR